MKNKFDPLAAERGESVPASSSVLTRLKTETRPQHDAIESALDLTSETLTLDAYRRSLERFHGFYRPLEAELMKIEGWYELGLNLAERQKTHLLESDLKTLGVSAFEQLPICEELPPHGTIAAAFGCLYVLEGATLGGQVISQMLRHRLGVTPETGGRFFHSYGDRTAAMWQAFRGALTAFVVEPNDEEKVVSAAKETFVKLQRWMTREGENG